MRKHVYLIFISIVIGINLQAQSMEFLDINNAKAAFWADGTMFWDKVSAPLFEWPQDSGTHVNFATGLWIGGISSTDTLKGAYKRYGTTGDDFYPGPLDTIGTASIDSETVALYNRVWKITKAEVDQFRLCVCDNPSDPSCTGYTIPNSIIDWPGNPILQSGGQHLYMSQNLAPFHDEDGDGVYNPMDCDYPLVKCDQSLFFVFNDRGGPHMESLLPSIGLEIRAMAYACSCDSVTNLYPDLENTVFLDLQVINRGTDTIYQTYAGLYSDADIGGPMDDYVGTHVGEGYIYHYNADGFDEDVAGTQGFGALPPAHGMVYLEGPWMDPNGLADYWDPAWTPVSAPPAVMMAMNTLASDPLDTIRQSIIYGINGTGFEDTLIDNERLGLRTSKYMGTPLGDPTLGIHYYMAQRAFWNDGSAQVYGCGGYPTGGCVASPRAWMVYPDSSDHWDWGTKGIDPGFPWNEMMAGNTPGDRRSLGSAGPFTLMPGETNTLTYAFVTARSTATLDSLSLQALHQAVVNVKEVYYQGIPTCSQIVGLEQTPQVLEVKMYPNPATQSVWLESTELSNAHIRIVDMMGRCVYQLVSTGMNAAVNIPVESLATGMYTVLIMKNGAVTGLKLIKQ